MTTLRTMKTPLGYLSSSLVESGSSGKIIKVNGGGCIITPVVWGSDIVTTVVGGVGKIIKMIGDGGVEMVKVVGKDGKP